MLDWHSCQIWYPLEIKVLLLLYLWWSNGAVKRPLLRPPTYFDTRENDYIVFQTGFNEWVIFLRFVCFFPGFIYLPPSVNKNFISRGYLARMQVQSRWGLRTSSMLQAGYPTLLAWRGRLDLSRLQTSRCYHTLSENGSRVFTHSLDVN